jgi:hypothetical protein
LIEQNKKLAKGFANDDIIRLVSFIREMTEQFKFIGAYVCTIKSGHNIPKLLVYNTIPFGNEKTRVKFQNPSWLEIFNNG